MARSGGIISRTQGFAVGRRDGDDSLFQRALLEMGSRMGPYTAPTVNTSGGRSVEEFHGWMPAGMEVFNPSGHMSDNLSLEPQFSAAATPDRQLKSVVGNNEPASRAFLKYGPIQQILGTISPGPLNLDYMGGIFQNGGAGVYPNMGQSGPGLAGSIGAGLASPNFGSPLVHPPSVAPVASSGGGSYAPRHDTNVNIDDTGPHNNGAGGTAATPPDATPATPPGAPATASGGARPGTGRGAHGRSGTRRPGSLTLEQAQQQMPGLTDKMIREAQGFVDQLEKDVQKMPEGDQKKTALANLAQAKKLLQEASNIDDVGEKFAMASGVIASLNQLAGGLSPSLMQAYNAAGGAADVVGKAAMIADADKASADAADIGRRAQESGKVQVSGFAGDVMQAAGNLKTALQAGDPKKIQAAMVAYGEAKQKLKAATGDEKAPTPTHGATDPARPVERPAQPAAVEPPPPSAEEHAAATTDSSPDGGVAPPEVAQNPNPPPARPAPAAGREANGADPIPAVADEGAVASGAAEAPQIPAPPVEQEAHQESPPPPPPAVAASMPKDAPRVEAPPPPDPVPPPPAAEPKAEVSNVVDRNISAQVAAPEPKAAAAVVRAPEPPAGSADLSRPQPADHKPVNVEKVTEGERHRDRPAHSHRKAAEARPPAKLAAHDAAQPKFTPPAAHAVHEKRREEERPSPSRTAVLDRPREAKKRRDTLQLTGVDASRGLSRGAVRRVSSLPARPASVQPAPLQPPALEPRVERVAHRVGGAPYRVMVPTTAILRGPYQVKDAGGNVVKDGNRRIEFDFSLPPAVAAAFGTKYEELKRKARTPTEFYDGVARWGKGYLKTRWKGVAQFESLSLREAMDKDSGSCTTATVFLYSLEEHAKARLVADGGTRNFSAKKAAATVFSFAQVKGLSTGHVRLRATTRGVDDYYDISDFSDDSIRRKEGRPIPVNLPVFVASIQHNVGSDMAFQQQHKAKQKDSSIKGYPPGPTEVLYENAVALAGDNAAIVRGAAGYYLNVASYLAGEADRKWFGGRTYERAYDYAVHAKALYDRAASLGGSGLTDSMQAKLQQLVDYTASKSGRKVAGGQAKQESAT